MRDKIKRYQYVCRTVFSSFCFTAILVSITQSFSNVSAVEGSASTNASVTVSSACSFGRTNGSDEYNGILANNSSVEIIGSTFTTFCNDPGGYAVYAIGYSNNEYGNTDLIYNNEPTSANNIKTNGDTTGSGNSNNGSSWKMKLVPVENNFTPTIENNYSSYNNIPSTYTKVASYNNVTINNTDSTTGSSITTHYQATASSTQPAGTYAGAVKYTMVHPGTNIPNQPYDCPANKICYFPNAGNTVVDTMGDQNIDIHATTATLWASNFQRMGYGFAGWNTEYDGSGTFYGPNEDIEFEAGQYSGVNGGLSLYAIWIESTGYLQDWNGCPALNPAVYNSETGKLKADLSSVTALTDKRDNQTYAVARLADGNCWMIENLRLEAEYTRGSYYQSLAQGYGGVFTGLADAETANFTNSTAVNKLGTANYYGTDGSGATNIIDTAGHTYGGTDYAGYYFPRYRNTNTASPATSPGSETNVNIYSYGNYYTWAAAMANTTFYSGYSGDTGSDAANTSLCPSGWRLPLGANRNTTNLSFSKLDKDMGGTGTNQSAEAGTTQSKIWRSFPNNFLYSGGAMHGSISYRGKGSGLYWASSTSTNTYTYNLNFDGSNVRPGTTHDYKFYGFTVRCISNP